MTGSQVSREEILNEIKRQADANDGVPLGRARFQSVTGIAEKDWLGRYWARWGDAITEAGFTPNQLATAHATDDMLLALAALVRDLGHFPTDPELRMKRREDASFPSHGAFHRLGNKSRLATQLVDFCREHEGYDDVVAICMPLASTHDVTTEINVAATGYVYLMKSGKHHKIGRTTDIGRRSYDIRLQLPDRADLVHYFSTDDPVGIERYWHDRFADRRANGEWFLLSKADVAAFKSRKRFM